MMKIIDYERDGEFGVYQVEYDPLLYQWLYETFGPEIGDGGDRYTAKLGFITFVKENDRTLFLLKWGDNGNTSS